MAKIYHVTTRHEWESAKRQGFYEAPSLKTEGFIHCSEAHQVAGVVDRYFRDKADLVKLVIDTENLANRLQYDLAPSVNEAFPHVYGVINLDAVVDVSAL